MIYSCSYTLYVIYNFSFQSIQKGWILDGFDPQVCIPDFGVKATTKQNHQSVPKLINKDRRNQTKIGLYRPPGSVLPIFDSNASSIFVNDTPNDVTPVDRSSYTVWLFE